ncbi:MAG TPA: EAL domain-containing protein, partial [Candidatus Manganitrophaceae bacterium]|nr:EAL domain-containing protein [Candidatus Manganitrophaceae bacterium]
KGVFGRSFPRYFNLEIYDSGPGTNGDPVRALTKERLMYDDDKIPNGDPLQNNSRERRITSLLIGGREWVLSFSARPDFNSGLQEKIPLLALSSGMTFGLLLFVVIWSMAMSRRRAVDLANVMTAELQKSDKEIKKLNENLEIRVIERTKQLETANRVLGNEIAERRRAEESLNYLTSHDPLTGLPNRMLFMDRLAQSLQRVRWQKRVVAALILDLDNFKQVNDAFGHTVGDQLLKAVAERLAACVRVGDTVARQGGDEFMLILENMAQAQDVPKVTHKILRALSEPFSPPGRELFVSASVGISLYPNDGEDAERLVKQAEAAMYLAKEQGRNNFQYFSPSMNTKMFERLALESGLRKGLEREEFLLHYQPQVDLLTGEVIGMEALLRWNHPDLGLVSPAKFIPLAEETGLIVPIGEWVLGAACRQNKIWEEKGLRPIRIAVNLSARQFQQHNLAETTLQALSEIALPPDRLELELTESVLMQKEQTILTTLRKLHEMGVQLSIDDFGTGYSSLSYLKSFPIHTLKIDQSFVRDIMTDSDHATIVTAIVNMAHSLRLKVIAEGVETAEQLGFLKALKCDEMQGYFFSRPLPPEEATQLLKEGRRLDSHPARS